MGKWTSSEGATSIDDCEADILLVANGAGSFFGVAGICASVFWVTVVSVGVCLV